MDQMSRMKKLREAAAESLVQAESLLDALARYPGGSALYRDGGIGEHARHIIDHFLAFRGGLEKGLIDYDRRNRGSAVSKDIHLARSAIRELLDWTGQALQVESNKPLEILSEISCRETLAVRIPSNVGRELHYLIYHSIHHLAYCALLARQAGVAIDPAIGLAPGTATDLKAVNA